MSSDPPSAPAAASGLAPGHTHCANCGAELMGPYCHRCGQSTRHTLKHVPALAADAVDSVFNIDGRIVRTLPALYLRPGFLALEYFAGRRTRYIPPFRLMFFMSVLAFLLIHLSILLEPPVADASTLPPAAATASKPAEPRTPERTASSVHINSSVLPAFVTARINAGMHRAGTNFHELFNGSRASRSQAWRRVLGNSLSVTPPALFVLMPLMALLLQLMYVFKRRLYIEHLIVALYSHAFIFMTLLLAVALALITAALPGWGGAVNGWLQAALWTWLVVYLLLMQKRVYRQGWFLTLLKYFTTGFFYSILLICTLIVAAIIGLAR